MFTKDSFDRFGDDLCELLLSFLPIIDKFRFECISKQWKSFIFNKQQKLILDFYEVLNNNTIKTPKGKKYELMFKTLFKKLKFLKDIECHHFFNTQTINSIIDNCFYVEKIGFNGNINQDLLLKLTQTLGKRFKSFDLSRIFNKKFDHIFTFTPNLRQIKLNKNLDQLIKIYLSKLEVISFPKNVDSEELKLFTDIYRKQMKIISVSYDCLPNNEVNEALIQLSRYENLESLSLNIKLPKNRASVIDSGLEMIGNKCKKLKRFTIKAHNKITNENLFHIFSRFHALVKLSVHFVISSEQSFGVMEDLSGCTDLKYLNLHINTLKDENFNNINLYLPNLKYFLLLSENDLTDNTLLSLAKLQSLVEIELYTEKVTDAGVCHVINNCPQIKTIIIYNSHGITETSMNTLIKLAIEKHKTQYKFVLPFHCYNAKRILPPNLSLQFL